MQREMARVLQEFVGLREGVWQRTPEARRSALVQTLYSLSGLGTTHRAGMASSEEVGEQRRPERLHRG